MKNLRKLYVKDIPTWRRTLSELDNKLEGNFVARKYNYNENFANKRKWSFQEVLKLRNLQVSRG
jgi:hypothetical protein